MFFSKVAFYRNATTYCCLTLVMVLTGCANMPRTPLTTALKIEKARSVSTKETMAGAATGRETLLSAPGLETPSGRGYAAPIISNQPPSLSGQNISINYEGIPLPEFVNEVFGELLQVTFEIDNKVLEREQLVTLRTASSMSPDDFFALVKQVLSNYGISVAYQNNIYRIIENSQAQKEIPRIIRSRAFKSVPGDMRPVFYYARVNNIRVKQIKTWLDLSLRNRVNIINIPYSNALLVLGSAEDVSAAMEVIEILDQPNLAGNTSLKISPAFWSADKLSRQLVQVLKAEGYSVEIGPDSDAPIKLIPVQALNTIMVFASSEQNLKHVLHWASELDQPGQTIDTTGVYYLAVENTNAGDIAELTTELLNTSSDNPDQQNSKNGETKVIVDKSRNALIFQGSAEEYAQFRSLVKQMDRAPFEVLIEATIAEVTLDKGESLGAILNFDNGSAAFNDRSAVQSSNGLLVNLIRDTGDLTASLQAAADNNSISILSSPRLVVASGKKASMTVGTQVPIITTQQTAPDGTIGGTSNILQQVQYRDTGITLSISPIVNSSQRVELTIAQEVSDAQNNDKSDIQSPIILTRSFDTTLSIDDGETVLLAGLISENYSKGNSGVPYLKDIPLLGNLFKSESQAVSKTELIVLLTPYIIDDQNTSRYVRDAFRSQLSNITSSFDKAETK